MKQITSFFLQDESPTLIRFAALAPRSGYAFITDTRIANFTNYVTIGKLISPLKVFKICSKVHSVDVFLNLILFSCSWFLSVAIFLSFLIISKLKSFHWPRTESLDTFGKNCLPKQDISLFPLALKVGQYWVGTKSTSKIVNAVRISH